MNEKPVTPPAPPPAALPPVPPVPMPPSRLPQAREQKRSIFATPAHVAELDQKAATVTNALENAFRHAQAALQQAAPILDTLTAEQRDLWNATPGNPPVSKCEAALKELAEFAARVTAS